MTCGVPFPCDEMVSIFWGTVHVGLNKQALQLGANACLVLQENRSKKEGVQLVLPEEVG